MELEKDRMEACNIGVREGQAVRHSVEAFVPATFAPIRRHLTLGVCLGDDAFATGANQRIRWRPDDLNFSHAQRRPRPARWMRLQNLPRSGCAVREAWATAEYSYAQIAAHLGVHLTTSEESPDWPSRCPNATMLDLPTSTLGHGCMPPGLLLARANASGLVPLGRTAGTNESRSTTGMRKRVGDRGRSSLPPWRLPASATASESPRSGRSP